MPVTTVKIISITTSLQAVRKALGIRIRYYRSAFHLSESDALQGEIYHDFGKLKSHFLRRIQSFLDTINQPKNEEKGK
jgi:hypothetical protein